MNLRFNNSAMLRQTSYPRCFSKFAPRAPTTRLPQNRVIPYSRSHDKSSRALLSNFASLKTQWRCLVATLRSQTRTPRLLCFRRVARCHMHLREVRDHNATRVLGMNRLACGIAWGALGATKARASNAASVHMLLCRDHICARNRVSKSICPTLSTPQCYTEPGRRAPSAIQ